MQTGVHLNLKRIAVGGLLLLAVLGPSGAGADMVEDWLAHKLPAAEPAISYGGAPIQLKFSHPNPPASLTPPLWRAGLGWLEQATKGKLAFKEYGAGTLHGAKDGFKAVKSGISDYATCFVAHEARGFQLSKAFELPFVTPANPLAATRIAAELAPKYFKPEFERQGVHYGYISVVSTADIMSKKPIRKLEDLKGMKVIAQGFEPEAAKALGAVFVNIPFPDIYTSFQQGIVDAVLWVDPGFVPFKIYEIAKYHTALGISAQHIDTCLSQKSFAALPPDLKKAFYGFQQRMAFTLTKRMGVDFTENAQKLYRQHGVEMITLPAEELGRWKAALKPIVDRWADEWESKGQPARALLADIDRLAKKYDGMKADDLFKLVVEQPAPGAIDF